MNNLIAATVFFLLIHLAIARPPIRNAITGRIGENAYLSAFSLVSIAGLVWMFKAFGDVRGGPAWWGVTPATAWAQLAINFLAFQLIIVGVTTRNPTSVRQENAVQRPDAVHGILRITRHPFLWGVALWAAGHLLVNGDLPSLILFGSLFAQAVSGTFRIDAKRRGALGEAWTGFAAATSNFPFAAIASGRQTLSLAELGWWRIGLAALIWAVVTVTHAMVFGARALP